MMLRKIKVVPAVQFWTEVLAACAETTVSNTQAWFIANVLRKTSMQWQMSSSGGPWYDTPQVLACEVETARNKTLRQVMAYT